MKRYVGFLVMGLLGLTSTTAATFYVDAACGTSGDGTTTTCGVNGPKKTITEGVALVGSAGDILEIRGGTYNEYVNVSAKNGASGNPITIRAYQAEAVIIDGTGISLPPDDAGFGIDDCTWIVVDGLESKNWPDSGDDPFAVLTTSTDIVLRNLTGHDGHSGLYLLQVNRVTVEDSEFYGNRFHGIEIDNSDNVTITRIVTHDNTPSWECVSAGNPNACCTGLHTGTCDNEDDGLHVNSSRDVLVQDSIAYNNYEQGFDASGHDCIDCSQPTGQYSSQRVTFKNCVAYDNGEAVAVGGFKVEGWQGEDITIENSIAWSNGGFCGFCILGSRNVTLKNSTAYANADGVRVGNCASPCKAAWQTGVLVRDNVIFDNSDQLTVESDNTSITLNYNGYFVSPDDADGFDYKACPGENLVTFNEYQTCSGQDANSATGNPLFVNTADPDGADNTWFTADDGLLLQAGSPYKGVAFDGLDMGYRIVSSDVTAPSAVSNLATTAPTYSCITLTWTSPGDDAGVGTATAYDIRWAASSIGDDAAFTAATSVAGEPTPQVAGSAESLQVCNLASATEYFFAVKTRDEVLNTSTISNSPSGTTAAAPEGRRRGRIPFIRSKVNMNHTDRLRRAA